MTLILILVVLVCTASQLSIAAHVNRIIGGNRARQGQFPFFAQLYVLLHDGDEDPISCGATLIHKQWILSAAHCLDGARKAWVNMGTIKADVSAGYIYLVGESYVHPGYVLNYTANGDVIQCINDVAVGKLEREYKLSRIIQTIYLPSSIPLCKTGTVVGVGQAELYPDIIDDYLKHATIFSKQRKELKNPNIIPPSKTLFFSEIPVKRRGYIYRGDSGGPFICTINRVHVQYGIISQSDNDTKRALVQSAYESVYMHLDFILQKVPDVEIYKREKKSKKERARLLTVTTAKATKVTSDTVRRTSSFLIAIFLMLIVEYLMMGN